MIPSKAQLDSAYSIVKPYVHRTPVLSSSLLNELTGSNLFFKCENFQKMGAFKMRGAVHAISKLNDNEKARGVVTHSSGNFAQALSLAAKSLNTKAYIVMPENAPEVKKRAVKQYGGIITESEATIQAREAAAEEIIQETGATFIHPSNDTNVILGQGTAAIELLEEQPLLDCIMVPVGGGGLIAGTALAAHYYGKYCKVIGGEPMLADDAYRSLKSGKIELNDTANTIADGLRTYLGDKNFPIIKSLVSEIIRVEEEEILTAMRLIMERMKIMVETSSAVPFAALLKEQSNFAGKNVGIIISGGNVDLRELTF